MILHAFSKGGSSKPLCIFSFRSESFTIKKKSSKMWMHEHINDYFVKQAKMYNYRSRAAFKLIEINHRYNILQPGYKVLDLGSAPGGWTQVAVEQTKSTEQNKTVLGVDLLEMADVAGAHFIKGDLEDQNIRMKIAQFFNFKLIDVVLSDMAPNFEGMRDLDHYNITQLNKLVLKMCDHNLRPGGTVLMKTLQGSDEKKMFDIFSLMFREFSRVKPSASRSRSSELYYLGKGFKISDTYQKMTAVYSLIKSGKPITAQELKRAGFSENHQKEAAEALQNLWILGRKIDQKYLEEFGVDVKVIDQQPFLKMNEDEERERKKICEKHGIDVAVVAKVPPKTLKELFESHKPPRPQKKKEKAGSAAERAKAKNKNELFDPDAEEEKDSTSAYDEFEKEDENLPPEDPLERSYLKKVEKAKRKVLNVTLQDVIQDITADLTGEAPPNKEKDAAFEEEDLFNFGETEESIDAKREEKEQFFRDYRAEQQLDDIEWQNNKRKSKK